MALFAPLVRLCDRHVRLVNFIQNTCLLVAIVAGLGSGASFMSAHVDLGNVQETALGMVQGLGNEILIASQLASAAQQPVLLLPSGPVQETTQQAAQAQQSITEARAHLHDASGNWSLRRYTEMRANLIDGYRALGVEVPVVVAETNLLQGRIECVSAKWPVLQDVDPTDRPKHLDCLYEVPNQAFNLGVVAGISGLVAAAAAALSPPGTGALSPGKPSGR